MTMYEVLSLVFAGVGLVVAIIAVTIARASLRRSNEAIKLSNTNNALVKQQLDQSTAVNAPHVVFQCDTQIVGGTQFTMVVKTLNTGGHRAEIKKGRLHFHIPDYPTMDQAHDLTGKTISPGVPNTIEFRSKDPVLRGLRADSTPAEIRCEAIYTRPDQEDGHSETLFVFDLSKSKFVEK